MKNEFTGTGPFLHDDPRDRPVAIYGGKTTLHLGGGRENFLLLPIIPEKPEAQRRERQGGQFREEADKIRESSSQARAAAASDVTV